MLEKLQHVVTCVRIGMEYWLRYVFKIVSHETQR